MKIREINLRNWRTHRGARFQLGPVTVITGPNDSGKSSILAAIEHALSGRCEWTNDKGLGGTLRTVGEDQPWGIILDLADGRRIERGETGLVLSWAPRAKSTAAAQTALESEFSGKTVDMVRLSLRAGRFFGLAEDKRKSFLGQLLEIEITPDRVRDALTEQGKLLGLPLLETAQAKIGWAQQLASVERAYKLVYEQRTGVNRALKEANLRLEDLDDKSKDLVWIPEEQGKALAARCQEVEWELRALDEERGRLVQQLKAWDTAAQTASKVNDETSEQDALEPVSESEFELVSNQIEALQAELQAAKELQATRKTAEGLAMVCYGRTLKLQQEVASAGECQWSPGLACVGAAARTASIAEQLDRVQAESDKADQHLFLLESQDSRSINEIDGDLRLANEVARTLRSKIAKQAARQAAVSWAQNVQTMAEANAAQAAVQRPGVERRLQEVEKSRSLQGPLLASLREELTQAREAAAQQLARDRARHAVDQLATEQACLEELCKFYAPSGFPARVLREQLDPFVQQLNTVLRAWDLAARYEDNLNLQVSRSGRPWIDYAELSNSGKILTGLAHQVAFAVLSQSGIVVVDPIDEIDDLRQHLLMSACLEASATIPGLDHIILIGVRSVDPGPEITRIDLVGSI